MVITKKPVRNTNDITPISKELAAESFIAGAGEKQEPAKSARENKTPVMIRFDPDLLSKVDEAAKRRGVSRSSWLQYTISRALEQGEG